MSGLLVFGVLLMVLSVLAVLIFVILPMFSNNSDSDLQRWF